jgi:threonine synthase
MTLRFVSTRGQAPEVGIREVALAGLAPDGGLYMPSQWPRFTPTEIAAMGGQTYQEIAFRVLRPFFEGAMADDALRIAVASAYAGFDDSDVTPLCALKDGTHILELFHGPTLAFKDVALQWLGHVFDSFLRGSGSSGGGNRMTVIGATSGDTGSAAIAALAGYENIDVFILYPQKGPSEIQRKQMTCVTNPNVHALALRGSFDDCQSIVKAVFANDTLCRDWNLTTINSINLLRILAQIVYYFYAASRVDGVPSFVVPTGNFGDVFAGYAAKRCGLPIAKLVVASNSNDILTRFFATGRMLPDIVQGTLSPSMDIQISSNFERLLFELCGRDGAAIRGHMDDLLVKNGFAVTQEQLAEARRTFLAGRATDPETLACINQIYKENGYVLDPHTAVGVKVARDLAGKLPDPVICLATAHPAKFPDTVRRAIGITPPVPPRTAALISGPERTTLLDANVRQVIDFITENRGL